MLLDRLSINQATVETTSTDELIEACGELGIRTVGLWRHKYIEGDVRLTRRRLDAAGLAVSSVCRGGFFTGTRSRAEADADNRRAIEEAAALAAPVLVLVCGPVVDGDFASGQQAVARGIETMLPLAEEAEVTLAVEPFHPMFAAERSVIVTLGQAMRLVERFDSPYVTIAFDTYHVWWDPELAAQLPAAIARSSNLHVGDWLVPTVDLLKGRGLPGDGVMDLTGLLTSVFRAGYLGAIEVEVLNPEVWSRPCREVIVDVQRRMAAMLGEIEEALAGGAEVSS